MRLWESSHFGLTPPIYQMPLPRAWYYFAGESTVFSVNIDETRTMRDLKQAIKAATKPTLTGVDANVLTLYRVAIDDPVNRKVNEYIKELKRLSQNLKECTELDEMHQVSEVFGEIPPPGKSYFILVRTPEGRSI